MKKFVLQMDHDYQTTLFQKFTFQKQTKQQHLRFVLGSQQDNGRFEECLIKWYKKLHSIRAELDSKKAKAVAAAVAEALQIE